MKVHIPNPDEDYIPSTEYMQSIYTLPYGRGPLHEKKVAEFAQMVNALRNREDANGVTELRRYFTILVPLDDRIHRGQEFDRWVTAVKAGLR